MEVMPYHAHASLAPEPFGHDPLTPADWRDGLPVVAGLGFTLRELTAADAPSLFAHLTRDEVSRFISPPPASVAGFERFIAWTHRERAAGRYACFAVVPAGETAAVGIFQVRRVENRDGVAEWGFILGAAYWGTGLFLAGAQQVVAFAFDRMGLDRLEARACVANGRGTGALLKLGAVCEAVLRTSFERHGVWRDQGLWSILAEDWRAQRATGVGGTPAVTH